MPPLDLTLAHRIVAHACPELAALNFYVGSAGPMPLAEAILASSADSPEALCRAEVLTQGVLPPNLFCGDEACEAAILAIWNA